MPLHARLSWRTCVRMHRWRVCACATCTPPAWRWFAAMRMCCTRRWATRAFWCSCVSRRDPSTRSRCQAALNDQPHPTGRKVTARRGALADGVVGVRTRACRQAGGQAGWFWEAGGWEKSKGAAGCCFTQWCTCASMRHRKHASLVSELVSGRARVRARSSRVHPASFLLPCACGLQWRRAARALCSSLVSVLACPCHTRRFHLPHGLGQRRCSYLGEPQGRTRL